MAVLLISLSTLVAAFDDYPAFKPSPASGIRTCTAQFTLESAAHGGVILWATLCAATGPLDPKDVEFERDGVVVTYGVITSAVNKRVRLDTPNKVANMKLCAKSSVEARLWATATCHIC